MYRNNLLHTGVAADTVPPPLNLKWKQTFGGQVDSSPAIVGSRLYVGSDDNNLYAIDTATGNIIWAFNEIAPDPTPTDDFTSSPTVATVGGATVIFVGNDNDFLYAIREDGATPFKLWDFDAGQIIDSSPVVTTIAGTQVVIFGDDNGDLYALVASTGALYPGWTAFANPRALGGAFNSSPAILGSTVFIGNDDGSLYAVNAATGVVLWFYSTGPDALNGGFLYPLVGDGGNSIQSSPAVANVAGQDLVFVGTDDNVVYAFVATSGVPQWTFVAGDDINSSPAISTIPSPPAACTPGPTLAIFFGSEDNNAYAVRASDGTTCWTFPSTGAQGFNSSPTVSGQTAYIGSDDNNLYAIDINTGSWQWSFPAAADVGDPEVAPNPAVSGTTVYSGSEDSSLYAFSPAAVTTTLTSIASSTTTTTTFTTTVSTGTTSTQTSTTSTTETSTIWTTTVPVPGPVPGFPIESILVGILGGLVALTLLRRRRRA